MKKTWLFAFALVIVVGAAWIERDHIPFLQKYAGTETAAATGPSSEAKPSGKHRGSGGPAPVKTVAAVKTILPADIPATGWADAENTTTIAAQGAGIITSISATDGAMVKKDDLIATLDDRTAKATVDKDQANIKRDQATLNEATVSLKRAQSLLKTTAGTQQTVDQAQEAYDTAVATLDADKAQLESDEVLLDHTIIRAPFAGRLGDITLSVGAYVSPGTAIVTVADYNPINIKFHMPESYLHQLKKALAQGAVAVSTQPRNPDVKPKQGTISFYDNTVDTASGTILVKARFDNPEGTLWPGQSINLVVHLKDQTPQIVVPTVAVSPGPDGFFAYVVTQDGKVHMKPVTVARSNGDMTAISKGLAAGDHVVVEGQIQLTDGQAVKEQFDDGKTQNVADAAAPGEGSAQ